MPSPAACRVGLVVYDVAGRRVKSLVSGHEESGYKRARRDGSYDAGRPVSNGVYFYRLGAGAYSETSSKRNPRSRVRNRPKKPPHQRGKK
jgi:flagellar hook assembly protein FlgD